MNTKPRARELGLPFEGEPGKWNAISDVPGVEVGYCTLISGDGELQVGKGPIRTGVTAILPRGKTAKPKPVWAAHYNLNGNGEMTGTHWINDAGFFISPICITNTHSVGMAHHASVGWMLEQYPEYFSNYHSWAMPVIAETYDGMSNDICGRHITEAHVLEALNGTKGGPIAEGNVGGGTGMQTYEFKGGTGTSSRVLNIDGAAYTLAALVQSNFGIRHQCNLLGVPVGKHLTKNAILTETSGHEQGSIIVIIATDAPLLPIQLKRLAKRGALGIGRTGSPGGHYSGDIMLAFSVANEHYFPALGEQPQPRSFTMEFVSDIHFDAFAEATVQVVEESIINAMIAAESVPLIKPAGRTLQAIDHQQLLAVMRKYGRL